MRQPYLIQSDIMGMTNLSPFDKIMILSIILTIIVVMLFCVQMSIESSFIHRWPIHYKESGSNRNGVHSALWVEIAYSAYLDYDGICWSLFFWLIEFMILCKKRLRCGLPISQYLFWLDCWIPGTNVAACYRFFWNTRDRYQSIASVWTRKRI